MTTNKRALTTRQLVALLRKRIGRRPPSHTLPGFTPVDMWNLYDTLCRAARAMGIRY